MKAFQVQLAFVFLANALNSAIVTQLYPYVGLLVQSLELTDRSATGYYAGYMSTAFMVGRTISSSLWGWTTDHWGRKPTLVLSLLLVGSASLGLGLSESFQAALIFRFLTGFFNSLLVTTTTLVSEIAPESYQVRAMSLQALTRQIGQIAGTLIGTLPDPMYAQFFKGTLLETYPFLLPNAIIALLCFLTALGNKLYLCETLHKPAILDLTKPLLSEPEVPAKPNTYFTLLADQTVLHMILIYSLTSAVQGGMMDLIPVWTWAKKSDGGLEMSTQTIGYTIASASTAMAVVQQILFVRLTEARGFLWMLLCNSVCLIPIATLMPQSHYLLDSPALFWAYLLTSLSLWSLFCQQVFTVEYLLINNSVQRRQRGKMNGLAMTISSLFRSAASPICTVVFARTATGGLAYPLDYRCAFSLITLVAAVNYLLSLKLPKSIERTKDYHICAVDNSK
jgi:hypothetical protein